MPYPVSDKTALKEAVMSWLVLVLWAMVTGEESASALKLLFLAAIVGGVVGLKLVR